MEPTMARMHSTTVATAHTSSCKLDEVATINSGYGFGSDMPACSCAFQSIFKSNSYIYINMPVGTSGLRERERGLVLRMLNERSMLQRRIQAQQATAAEEEPCPHLFPLDLTEPESEEGTISSDVDAPPTVAPLGAGADCSCQQGPPPCSWLTQGQIFHGYQRFSSSRSAPADIADDWQVSLQLYEFDTVQGYACGIMTAQNVPHRREPIVTFFEADVIDNIHHTFYTGSKWGASVDTDMSHWSKFPGFLPTLRTQAQLYNGKCPSLSTSGSIFMRLKEQFFVNAGPDCGLTIAGFYYISVCRQSGCITGYYWDPSSTPFQLLHLKPASKTGVSFGSYEFH